MYKSDITAEIIRIYRYNQEDPTDFGTDEDLLGRLFLTMVTAQGRAAHAYSELLKTGERASDNKSVIMFQHRIVSAIIAGCVLLEHMYQIEMMRKPPDEALTYGALNIVNNLERSRKE